MRQRVVSEKATPSVLHTQHRVSEGVARDASGWVCCPYSQVNGIAAVQTWYHGLTGQWLRSVG